MISMKNLLFPSFLMNRKQIVTTLSFGLMGLILLISAGCDRFDLGMIDNNRDELDAVDPKFRSGRKLYSITMCQSGFRFTDPEEDDFGFGVYGDKVRIMKRPYRFHLSRPILGNIKAGEAAGYDSV